MIQGALNPSQLDTYCRENGFVRWFETSAKDGTNVEEATSFLVRKILETESQATAADQPVAADHSIDVQVDAKTYSNEAKPAQQQEGGGCNC